MQGHRAKEAIETIIFARRIEPNRTGVIYEDLDRVIYSIDAGRSSLRLSVVIEDLIPNFEGRNVLFSIKITTFFSTHPFCVEDAKRQRKG